MVLWRKGIKTVNFDWLFGGWCSGSDERSASKLKDLLNAIINGSRLKEQADSFSFIDEQEPVSFLLFFVFSVELLVHTASYLKTKDSACSHCSVFKKICYEYKKCSHCSGQIRIYSWLSTYTDIMIFISRR